MFPSYPIEDFVGKKLKAQGLLIHRLENVAYLPPKHIKSPHKHLFYELFLMEDGHAMHNVDFSTYHVKNDNLFLINQEQVHHWAKNISNEIKGYRILFTTAFLQNSFAPTNFLFELMYTYQIRYNPLVTISKNNHLNTYAQLLLNEYLQEKPSLESLKALLFLLLNEIKKNIIVEENKLYPNNQIRMYKLFLQEIEANYHKDITLKEYAEKVNISTRQLSRMVKQISNTTLNKIIIDRRILQAKRLLKYSDLSISEIAYEIGLKDPSYFFKIFKKNNGISPLEFRKQQ